MHILASSLAAGHTGGPVPSVLVGWAFIAAVALALVASVSAGAVPAAGRALGVVLAAAAVLAARWFTGAPLAGRPLLWRPRFTRGVTAAFRSVTTLTAAAGMRWPLATGATLATVGTALAAVAVTARVRARRRGRPRRVRVTVERTAGRPYGSLPAEPAALDRSDAPGRQRSAASFLAGWERWS